MPTTLLMTFGQKAAYSGRMILIGMGAIFLSLAIIWGVVELFRRLVTHAPEEDESDAPAPAAAPAPAPSPASDDALIAAITAAVAATLAEENGGTAPAFRVVSFQKVQTVSKRK